MDNVPSIVVVSSSSSKPKSIIKLITKEEPVEDSSGVIKQPWKIDTKYYSAIVNLIGIQESYKCNNEFNKQVEALVIHMDTNKVSGLDDLKQWEKLQTDCNPEVKLLISNYCNEETKITKTDAITWCLNKGFEFIELYPSDTMQNSKEDIIPEKFGVSRVIEALQSHTWSNLVMKKTKQCQGADNLETLRKATAIYITAPELTGDVLSEEDDFTELFSNLHMMKDGLQSLPMNHRKQCAEQMVTAFWKAIGGDDEELGDL